MNLPRLCFAIHKEFLLSSAGPSVDVYEIGDDLKRISRIRVFEKGGNDIYGMEGTLDGVFVFGERCIALIGDAQISQSQELPIQFVKCTGDFVTALRPFDNGQVAILYGSNNVLLANYSTKSGGLEFTANKEIHCNHQGGISCGLISGTSWADCCCIVGTALGEILAWHPAFGPDIRIRMSKHHGMIFKLFQSDHFLYSISDDRSLRVWPKIGISAENGNVKFSEIPQEIDSVKDVMVHQTRPWALFAVPGSPMEDLVYTGSTDGLLYTFQMKQKKHDDSGSEQTKWDLQLSSNRQMGHGEIRAITRVDKFLLIGSKCGSLLQICAVPDERQMSKPQFGSPNCLSYAYMGDFQYLHLDDKKILMYGTQVVCEGYEFKGLKSSSRSNAYGSRVAVAWSGRHYAIVSNQCRLQAPLDVKLFESESEEGYYVRDALVAGDYVLIVTIGNMLFLHRANGQLSAKIETTKVVKKSGKFVPYTSFHVFDDYAESEEGISQCLLFVGTREGGLFTALVPMQNQEGVIHEFLESSVQLQRKLCREPICDMATWLDRGDKKLLALLHETRKFITIIDFPNNEVLSPDRSWHWQIPICFSSDGPFPALFLNNPLAPPGKLKSPEFVCGFSSNKFCAVNITSGEIVWSLDRSTIDKMWSFEIVKTKDCKLMGKYRFLQNEELHEISSQLQAITVKEQSIHTRHIFAAEELHTSSDPKRPSSTIFLSVSIDNSFAISRYDSETRNLQVCHRESGGEPELLTLHVVLDADSSFNPSHFVFVGRGKSAVELWSIDSTDKQILSDQPISRCAIYPPSPISNRLEVIQTGSFKTVAISSIMKNNIILFGIITGDGRIEVFRYSEKLAQNNNALQFLAELTSSDLSMFTQISLQLSNGANCGSKVSVFATTTSSHLRCWTSLFCPWGAVPNESIDKWTNSADVFVERAGLSSLAVDSSVWRRCCFLGSEAGIIHAVSERQEAWAVDASARVHSSTITRIVTAKRSSDAFLLTSISIDSTLCLTEFRLAKSEMIVLRCLLLSVQDPTSIVPLQKLPSPHQELSCLPEMHKSLKFLVLGSGTQAVQIDI